MVPVINWSKPYLIRGLCFNTMLFVYQQIRQMLSFKGGTIRTASYCVMDFSYEEKTYLTTHPTKETNDQSN